ncbi:MAG: biotin transporter BioY [Candidatus Nanopelagicales bacterium]|nr:biotin transporter BioY [Candidatus Nanopelagicales bacterium]MDZ4250777.1 biotin transporter BioY [Candidatus Nanopelagicales bacterium]
MAAPAPRVLADVLPRSLIRSALLVALGASFVGLAAQFVLPMGDTPAPMSGQTLAVLLVGASLGCIRGTISMLVYVVAGIAGVPWFADGASGYSSVSGGYLIGFVVAAGLVGFLAERNWTRTALDTALCMVLGSIAIYIFGVAGLAMAIHTSIDNAIALGMSPFLLGDGIKIAVAAVLFPLVWSWLVRSGRALPYNPNAADASRSDHEDVFDVDIAGDVDISGDADATDADAVLDLTTSHETARDTAEDQAATTSA